MEVEAADALATAPADELDVAEAPVDREADIESLAAGRTLDAALSEASGVGIAVLVALGLMVRESVADGVSVAVPVTAAVCEADVPTERVAVDVAVCVGGTDELPDAAIEREGVPEGVADTGVTVAVPEGVADGLVAVAVPVDVAEGRVAVADAESFVALALTGVLVAVQELE